uniref:SFRICE_031396 n=1 Tax=Spodoptera frugiperda TaxID=7108 RepID=A0A2H1WQ19_SPOFR
MFLDIRIFIHSYRGCVYKNSSSHTHLWITQRIAPCRNQTCYTLRGSRLSNFFKNFSIKRSLRPQNRNTGFKVLTQGLTAKRTKVGEHSRIRSEYVVM